MSPDYMILSSIIDDLNECAAEMEDAGEWNIECVIDQRADEGLPPFTPEELAKARADCDRVADIVQNLEQKMDDLLSAYYDIAGRPPYYSEIVNRYSIDFRPCPD